MINERTPFQGSDRKDRFPPNWDILKRKVLIRDQRVCKLAYPECTHAATQVDHIDDNSENNLLNNLQAVCNACHVRKSGELGRKNRTQLAPHIQAHPGVIAEQIINEKALDLNNTEIKEKPWIQTTGPMWDKDADGKYILPKKTLGYHVIYWATQNLRHAGEPFKLTGEQARFILYFYAINEKGEWINRIGVKIAPKGWGKDPLGAYICAVELVGPCRFAGWDEKGNPKAKDEKNAIVHLAAVRLNQNQNTWEHLVDIFSPEAKIRYEIDTKATVMYAYGRRRRIEQQTSNPTGLEGARTTFALCNETEHWLESNGCIKLWTILDRNCLKVKGSHLMTITNMPNPTQNSITQRHMEAYEDYIQGRAKNPKILLDFKGVTDAAPIEDPEVRFKVMTEIYGASVAWNNIQDYVDKFDDVTTDPAENIQFFMNGVGVDKASWIDIRNYDACRVDDVVIPKGIKIILAGDGSKNDDSTGVVGMIVDNAYPNLQGLVFKIGVWEKPAQSLLGATPWQAPRDEVMGAIQKAFHDYRVTAFWFDPSHKKDEVGNSYWVPMLNDLHLQYSSRIKPQFWASKYNAFIWDMASSVHQKEFVAGLEVLAQEITDIRMKHTDDLDMRKHFQNARRTKGMHGYSIGKAARQSPDKIDLAVCVGIAYVLFNAVIGSKSSRRNNAKTNTYQT